MRARRSRSGRLPLGPTHRGERLVDRPGQVGEVERQAGPAYVRLEVLLLCRCGSARNCATCSGRSVESARTPVAEQLGQDGIGRGRAGSPPRDRLRSPGCRTPPRLTGTPRGRTRHSRRPACGAARHDREWRAFDDAIERRSVAVLGGTRQPVAERPVVEQPAEALREAQPARHVLALDRARGLEEHELVVARSRIVRVSPSRSPGGGIEIEVVVDRRRVRVARALRARGGCAG